MFNRLSRFIRTIPQILLLTLIFPVLLDAQWSNDPYENILISDMAAIPLLVSDGYGGCVLTYWSWEDYKIHALRFDKLGYPCWGTEGVLIDTDTLEHDNYVICQADDNSTIIAYTKINPESPYYYFKLYAQRLDSSGNRLWGDSGVFINSLDSVSIGYLGITSNVEGGAYITWTDSRTSSHQLYGQRIDSFGNIEWAPNGVCLSGGTGVTNLRPVTVTNTSNKLMVFWQVSSQSILRGQLIDADGTLNWGDEGILLPENLGEWNSGAADQSGGCILTGRIPLPGPGTFQHYSQRIDSAGTILWGESCVAVSDTHTANSFHAPVVHNEFGSFIAWDDDRTGTYESYINNFSDEGMPLWGEFGIPVTISDTVTSMPNPCFTSDGNIVVVHMDARSANTIRAQKFNLSGERLWDLNDIIISHNWSLTYDTYIVSDHNGGIFVCWPVYPALVYVQQISSNGNLGEVLSVKSVPTEQFLTTFELLPAYPNPFNSKTNVKYFLNMPGMMSLTIFDLQGRQVMVLDEGFKQPGNYSTTWKAGNIASGIYFLSLTQNNRQSAIPIIHIK
ncbi:MAG: T9SS type A sorting domain-containing protein [FCB group bacterium]|nr:T9SS type A sorting domain-containing protein [FCB group bacterium]